jgi:hypothetical protein
VEDIAVIGEEVVWKVERRTGWGYLMGFGGEGLAG